MSNRKRDPKFPTSTATVAKPGLDTIEEIFSSARLAAVKCMKICAPAIRALYPVFMDPSKGLVPPTFAVDKYYRCYVNTATAFQFVEMAKAVSEENPCTTCGAKSHHPIAYVAGVICHEACHPVRQHMDRAVDNMVTNLMVWNIAADEEINDDLLELFSKVDTPKLCLPPGVMLPKNFGHEEGKLAEHYYFKLVEAIEDELQKMRDKCPVHGKDKKNQDGQDDSQDGDKGDKQKAKGQGQGEGEGQEDGQGQGEGEGEGQGQGEGEGQGQGTGHGHGSGPQCTCPHSANHGSGVDGQERPWDKGPPDKNNPGLSEVEGRMVRKNVAETIQREMKDRGNVPGGFQRWAEEFLAPPKYDWRQEMRKILRWATGRVQGDQERTYRRLGRRCAAVDYKIIFPNTYTPRPTVVVVQDTSGSMGDTTIGECFREAEGIIKAAGGQVKVIMCDMHPDVAQNVSSMKQAVVHGGGGTDMTIGIKAAMLEKPRPNLVVLFTDGYTPWPDAPLEYNTHLVVGLVGQHCVDVNEPPSWATVIRIVGDDIIVKKNT